MVSHEKCVMDENLIFFSALCDCLKGDACSLSLVETEGSVIGSAEQVVGVRGLYDTEWASHGVNKAQRVPKVSDTRILFSI